MGVIRLEHVRRFRLAAMPPYDFEKTFEKYTKFGSDWFWLSPCEVRSPTMVCSGLCLGKTLSVGIKVTARGSNEHCRLTVSVYTKNPMPIIQYKYVRKLISWGLGVHEDLREFYKLCDQYKYLRQARNDLWGMRELPFIDGFGAILFAIALQRTSPGRTIRMLECLAEQYGPHLEFDGCQIALLPRPQSLSRLPLQRFKRCKVGYRAKYIKQSSESACARAVDMLVLSTMSGEEARRMLRPTFKGIGPYSLDVILPHPSFPIDSWNRRIFQRIFGFNARVNDLRIKRFAEEHFGPWQKLVHSYILNNLENLQQTLRGGRVR